MTLADAIHLAAGNLRRMKLRVLLTVAGVTIAIGAFVSMVSFGVGSQKQIGREFRSFGLLHTMHVYPEGNENEEGEEEGGPLLTDETIRRFASLPGVRLAYAFESFPAEAIFGDTTLSAEAQALPLEASRTRLYSELRAGRSLDHGADGEALLTTRFLETLGGADPDSAVGRSLVLVVRRASLDSALVRVVDDRDGRLGALLARVGPDSLARRDARRRLVRRLFSLGADRFIDGLLTDRAVLAETLTVVGVIDPGRTRRTNIKPILVSPETARRLGRGTVSDDPADLWAALSGGALFESGETAEGSYPHVTLDLETGADHGAIGDTIETMGYRAFSYARRYDEIRRAYFYFELVLSVIGAIALVTASLGIVNTMVMSIIERRREIGVLKSLGASEGEIRRLFFVESGVIGFLGGVAGILLGWIVARVGALVFQEVMRRQGVPPMDFFSTPLRLSALALAIAVLVSLAAGAYPAARAARVDPVRALRDE